VAANTPFRISVDGNYIFVANYGTEDWKGPLNVNVSCVPVAPTTTCGPDFPGGKFLAPYPSFPPGHGNVPVKASGKPQDPWGPGWIAVFMGLPRGSYRISVTAAGSSSPDTAVTIAAPSAAKPKASPAANPAAGPGAGAKAKPGAPRPAPTKVP
jgi:hypothetical protein